MSDKHSTGPWAIERRRSAITAIGPCVADEYAGSAWLDVSEEDARLIAAAPDLLDACRKALYALKGREHDQFLRDAIAKATGASP